ncbi:MAG: EAL domain-containing protein [Treponema sp.]
MELSDNLMYTAMQRLILLHYQKVLYVDLTEDFYSVLKVSHNEWNMNVGEKNSFKISEWFKFFAESSLCYDTDRETFRMFSDIENLKDIFRKNGEKPLRCSYRRKSTADDLDYHQCVMELFPYTDKNEHLIVFLFVREATENSALIQNTALEQMDENKQLIEHQTINSRRKILIIEDNPINRNILSKFLQKDYEIIEAENGLLGLDILFYNYQHISAVILDLYMPVIDGFEFLKKVQSNPILASIPILVATTANDSNEEERCLSLGAADFVSKPYNATVVKMRLGKIIKMREDAELYSTSEYDSMTGFYTKEAFCHHIDMTINGTPDKSFDLIVSNIDNIHSIEKLYGRETAIKVIKQMAESIKNCGKPALFYGRIRDNMFAGFGVHSENFNETYFKDEVRQMAESSPIQNIQVKFGVYRNVDKDVPATTLLNRTSSAMETISRQYGINVAYYDEKVVERQAKDDAMENAFESAIEQEDFEVWFQPKYSAKTKKIIGAEALIRWRGKDGNLIPPGEFIPLFERDGLIPVLDEYVFKKVCSYQKQRKAGGDFVIPISVNLSRASLFRKDFVKSYTGIVDEIGIDPLSVPIEITESMALKSSSFKIFAEELINKGFSLHMDDFGSGYSSLASLQILRFDVIKLDKSLIDFIGTPGGESLIKHTVAFAKESGMNVVAEGVETKEQLDFLQRIGCDSIQGFYFSPPVTRAEFERLILRGGEL